MSKVHLKDLKKIEQSRKDAVFGYIRNNQLKDKEFPKEIILICILFFGKEIDSFDPKWKGAGMTLSNDNRRVEYKNSGMQSLYCKKIVESGYHEWKFKVVQTKTYGGYFTFGLWRCSKNKNPPLNTYFTKGANQGYGYSVDAAKKSRITNGSCSEPFGVLAKSGDIVEMMVDFEQLTLCWKVNGESYGKSHDITQDKYRAAIYMGYSNKIVEIMD